MSTTTSASRYWLLGACLLLILLPFVLFWQLWWPDPTIRLGFAYGDFHEQNYPIRRYVAQEWRQGRMPLWDPYTFGGQPAAGSSLFQTFYPPGFWQTLFADLPRRALELEAVFHLGLAGLFTFLFLYELTGRLDAAFIGGFVFSWGGLLTSWPTLQFWILETMVWMPGGLWLLERGLKRRSCWWGVAAAIPYSFSILAGHGQTVLYSAYLSGAYLLWRAVQLRLSWRFVLRMALTVGGLTLAFSAMQWLPSVEMVPISHRADWTYADLAQGFQVRELLGILRPNLGEWSPLYVGWIPLTLVLLSPLLAWRFARESLGDVGFWLIVAVLSLLLALGQNGFLYSFFYRFAPGFNVFRHQERIAYLFSFSLAVLATHGFSALTQMQWWPRWGLVAIVLLTGVDLYRANNGVILAPPSLEVDLYETQVSRFLGDHLAAPVTRFNSEGLLPGDGNAGLVYRLRDVTGNNPIRLGAYELTLQIVPEVRWWQLFNVEYVVTRRTFDYPGISLAFEDTEGDIRVHRLEFDQQPVWITHDVDVMPNQEAAIYFTSDMGKVDPLQTAVLETAPDPAPQPAAGPESARITDFSPHRVAAEVELSAPGVVVFSEIDYPGWVAYANGERVESLRAFGILRAVALPAGEWEIEWRFRPLTVYAGLALCGVTVLGLSIGLVYQRNRSTD